MKIGIIGSGPVGRVLGAAFLKEGHAVMLGTRDTAKPDVAKWKLEHATGQTGSFAGAAAFGELIVLATAGHAAEAAIEMAGFDHFRNKIVIDTTNPIAGAPQNGVLRFFTDKNYSLMQQLQSRLPEARLVKAFNSVGNGAMYKPSFAGGRPTMFICGNDSEAKKMVTDMLDIFGWETEDMGSAESAGVIEQLCILWCIPGFLRNEWTHAFKLLRS